MAFPLGEVASLGAACCWAVGLNLFRRDVREIGSRAVNLFKGMLGSTLFLLVLLAAGARPASDEAKGALLLSGVIGLAIGDTLLFLALARVGPHKTALLASLGPVMTAIGGWLFLAESLTPPRIAGIVLAGAGVTLVVYARPEPGRPRADGAGVALGLLAALCQTIAVLLSKRALREVPPLDSAALRLVAATAALALFGLLRGDLGRDLRRLFRPAPLRRLLPAAFVGTFAGIGLMQVGIAHTKSAVANALHSTTPLFTLPIAVLVFRERPGPLAVLGSLVGVGGVVLLLTSQST